MYFQLGDVVRLARTLIRSEEVYVDKGKEGVVWALFPNATKPRRKMRVLKRKTWYAQVLLFDNHQLVTVRLTSLEHL